MHYMATTQPPEDKKDVCASRLSNIVCACSLMLECSREHKIRMRTKEKPWQPYHQCINRL